MTIYVIALTFLGIALFLLIGRLVFFHSWQDFATGCAELVMNAFLGVLLALVYTERDGESKDLGLKAFAALLIAAGVVLLGHLGLGRHLMALVTGEG